MYLFFCCFLCLLCRFGAVPTGICVRTAGGRSITVSKIVPCNISGEAAREI